MVCPAAQRADTVESLASTLVDSQVDLNPHQVEAALSRYERMLMDLTKTDLLNAASFGMSAVKRLGKQNTPKEIES